MRTLLFRCRRTLPIIATALLVCAPTRGVAADTLPSKYTLDYPAVTKVVPPVRSTFYEVTRTVERVNGKTFRHPLNGGYGFRMKQKIAGARVVHLGADLGWFRVGDPVVAVADGVVRLSRGALLAGKNGKRPAGRPPAGTMLWGNFIVIEHKLKKDVYVTTLYGHLDSKRLVKAGDIVKAGQKIGTIGRQAIDVNGGYKPHLHFGVRPGRAMEIGRTLLTTQHGDSLVPVSIAAITPERVQLDFGPLKDRARGFRMNVGGKTYAVEEQDGKFYMPASMLWSLSSLRSFPLVGYAQSTKGWTDPIRFLRKPSSLKPEPKPRPRIIKLKALAVVGKPAAGWGVASWANLPSGKTSLDVGDYKGKLVVIFCFQAACPRCKAFGFPQFRKIVEHYGGKKDVNFVAVQIAHEDLTRNTFSGAKTAAAAKNGLKIPIGHDGKRGELPTLMEDYGVIGTPWLIVIGRDGRVRFNVVMPTAVNGIRMIDRVKAFKTAAPSKSR